MVLAVTYSWAPASFFLSLFAVCRRFSLQPSHATPRSSYTAIHEDESSWGANSVSEESLGTTGDHWGPLRACVLTLRRC